MRRSGGKESIIRGNDVADATPTSHFTASFQRSDVLEALFPPLRHRAKIRVQASRFERGRLIALYPSHFIPQERPCVATIHRIRIFRRQIPIHAASEFLRQRHARFMDTPSRLSGHRDLRQGRMSLPNQIYLLTCYAHQRLVWFVDTKAAAMVAAVLNASATGRAQNFYSGY